MLRFGVELVPDVPPSEFCRYVRLAEELGFDTVWVTDHYYNRNVYVMLTYAALSTRRVKLGVGVTNPYVVHPAWTASAIATLAEISNYRVLLGIGAGDKLALKSIGIRREMAKTRVREAVEIIRALLEGGAVSYNGKVFTIVNAKLNYKVRERIRIYIGAQAGEMLRLSGEVGDGVLINASDVEYIRYAVDQVRDGLRASGRDIRDFDVGCYICMSVDNDVERAKRAVRPVVVHIAAGASDRVLEMHGVDVNKVRRARELIRRGRVNDALTLIDDDLISKFSVTGDVSKCAEKLSEIIRCGVTHVVLSTPPGSDRERSLVLIRDVISRAMSLVSS